MHTPQFLAFLLLQTPWRNEERKAERSVYTSTEQGVIHVQGITTEESKEVTHSSEIV